MQKTKEISISDAEWEVMHVVWANIQVTSRDVIDVLKNKMDWKESTIKTLIGRLVDKEALETKREGRAFIYSAKISEEDTVNRYSEDILNRVCNKKHLLVLKDLIGEAHLSQSGIEELINQLEDKKEAAPEIVACDCAPGQCDCHLIEEMKEK